MNPAVPGPIRIATRSSALALWQAQHVARLIEKAAPEATIEIVHVSTIGDRDQAGTLRDFGGVGVFTREVQTAVLDGRADLAVHSLKDLPTESAAGLCLAAVPTREETDDALLTPLGQPSLTLASLSAEPRVGTGSLRRRAQLLFQRPDLRPFEVRGNVETRIRKLDAGEFDALVLAVAGLKRLGLESRVTERLAPPVMYPAVGQGALGIECRDDDKPLRNLLCTIVDPDALARVTAERSLLAHLRAGCHAPVGAASRVAGDSLALEAVVLSADGRVRLVESASGLRSEALQIGIDVARRLLDRGAAQLIAPTPAP